MRSGKALILDFGGVVTRTLFNTHDLTERALGLAPGTRACRACLAALNRDASDRVSVDDQLKNVAGAIALGIPTVHFDVTNPTMGYAKALAMLGGHRKGESDA